MEPQSSYTSIATFLPSPKTTRGMTDIFYAGYPSSLDVSQGRLLYFNSSVVAINQATKPPIFVYHGSNVTAASFSQDGRFVASADTEGNLLVHLLEEDKAVLKKTIEQCFAGSIKCICWCADNKTVVVVGYGKNVFGRIINLYSGYAQGDISQVSKNLLTAAIRSDKPLAICVAGEENSLRIYEGTPCLFVKSESQHTSFTNQVRYSPDGRFLVSVSSDKRIVLYDAKSTTVLKSKYNAHEAGIMGCDWIDDQRLVTCSNDKTIKIWSVELYLVKVLKIKENPTLDDFQVAVRASAGDVYSISLNGNINWFKQPLAATSDCPTEVWQGMAGQPVRLFADDKNSTFYVVDSSGRICIDCPNLVFWSKEYNRLRFFESTSDTKMFFKADISHGTIYVLTGDGFVRKYDTASRSQKSEYKVGNFLSLSADPSTADSYALAGDQTVTLFKNGKRKDIKTAHEASTIRFGPDGIIAVGTIKGKVVLYNNDLTEIHTLNCANVKITKIRFDGPTIYVGDSSKMINVWNWKDAKASDLHLGFHTGLIYDMCIGSKVVVSGGVDNKVVVCDKEKLHKLLELPHHHKRGVIGVGILGNCLVTVGGDMLIKVVRLTAIPDL